VSDGPTDLSERWLMNVDSSADRGNWIINKSAVFNDFGGGVLNKDYRYTKGGYGNNYSLRHNWVNELPSDWKQKMLTKTPKIERQVIFKSRSVRSRNNVAVMSNRTIEKIKRALVENQGPVLVVYKDDVWHAVVIVGYDDEDSMGEENKNCKFTRKAISHLSAFPRWKARRAIARGGCEDKGVFYVRESEYYDESFYQKSDILYDYDLTRVGEEAPYVAPYVKREYEWIKYLGNHAVSIYRADVDKAPFPPKKASPTSSPIPTPTPAN
jgi:hypothetical protein